MPGEGMRCGTLLDWWRGLLMSVRVAGWDEDFTSSITQ